MTKALTGVSPSPPLPGCEMSAVASTFSRDAAALVGGLIQAAVGSTGGCGALRLNRSGCARKAASRVAWRSGQHRNGVPPVHAVRSHVADARVTMLGVVPSKEGLAVGACILDATEALGEV